MRAHLQDVREKRAVAAARDRASYIIAEAEVQADTGVHTGHRDVEEIDEVARRIRMHGISTTCSAVKRRAG